MLGDFMNKMQEMQKKVEESKARLENITVEGSVSNGEVKVTANGNRKITDVTISEELIKEGDKDQIEDYVAIAVNIALEQAEKVNEAEMKSAASGLMPGFQGMFK